MYEYIIAVGMVVLYGLLLLGLPMLFGSKATFPDVLHVFRSVGSVVLVTLGLFAVSFAIPDPFWSNRALHALGGGFAATFVCFCAAVDARLLIRRVQFVVIGVLIVTMFGVVNEIAELALHSFKVFTFAVHPMDTWLDLLSNMVGVALALMIFTPFFHPAAAEEDLSVKIVR